MVFPYDFGFIPSTLADDGDPLDVLLVSDAPTFPGCLVQVQLLGVLEAEQKEDNKTERNDRLVGVPVTSYNPPEPPSLLDLGEAQLPEIEHFFVSYNEAEGRTFRITARRGRETAERHVDEGVRKFTKRRR